MATPTRMMRSTERSRLLFAILSPAFLLLCVVAIHGEDSHEWTRYQSEFAGLHATVVAAKLEEARSRGDAPEVARWERVAAEVAARKPELRQVFVQSLDVADRCTSCHLGIDDPLFADAPQPFRTHSGELLSSHDVSRFGCTVCHDGQGSATTVEAGHGQEENWLRPLLPSSLIQSTCTRCHPVTSGLKGGEKVSAGAELFLSKGCYACHDVEGVGYLPKFAPPLNDLPSKLQDAATWTAAWIRQPSHVAPDTVMPDFLLDDEQAGKIAAFLLSQAKSPTTAPAASAEPGSATDGKRLFTERGCRGCHGVEPGEHSVSGRVPHLGTVGSKVKPDWLDRWIADPRKINPDTAMPKIALTDPERRSIVAYLMTMKRSEALPPIADIRKFSAAEGKELVKNYECFGCHTIAGFEDLKPSVPKLGEFARRPVAELDFGSVKDLPRTKWDWLRHKLREPRAYESEKIVLRMPKPALTDEEAESIVAYVIGLSPPAYPADYSKPATPARVALRNVDWMLTRLNCNGCHPLRGKDAHIASLLEKKSQVAPTLDGVGARLQGQYMYEFLLEPKSVRPWLTLRMPGFGFEQDEARMLVEGFAATAGTTNPYTYVSRVDINQEKFERGARRFAYYKCIQCHPSSIDQGLPEGLSPDDLSINLMLSKQRLRPEWFADFLARPKQIAGNSTRMPTVFYTVEGTPKVDHPDTDIADIVTYVMGMKEDAETTLKSFEEERKVEEKKADVDWSNIQY